MAAFWLFTWDDMAAYDIPAAVGYVLRLTGHQQLAYVGHSQVRAALGLLHYTCCRKKCASIIVHAVFVPQACIIQLDGASLSDHDMWWVHRTPCRAPPRCLPRSPATPRCASS